MRKSEVQPERHVSQLDDAPPVVTLWYNPSQPQPACDAIPHVAPVASRTRAATKAFSALEPMQIWAPPAPLQSALHPSAVFRDSSAL